MQNNFFQNIIFKDTKEMISYFKIIQCPIVPRVSEELVEITENHIQNYKVEKIIYNLDIDKIDFVNVFFKDIHFENSKNKDDLIKFFAERGWSENK
ncbi:hypothetical protein [Cetobacterium sp. SF1]|uniref:hypothetical protein n=1 Tax=unclassified Cetobacterium TaxID=2630983 RepID=UPI003CEF4B4E